MRLRRAPIAWFALIACLALSGCAAGSAAPAQPVTRAAIPPPPKAPTRMTGQGIEGVIDATAAQLVQKFGRPRIDLSEGDARKLQFAGDGCVLDIYLYTLETGGVQRATWLDARRLDGQSVDPAACIAALEN